MQGGKLRLGNLWLNRFRQSRRLGHDWRNGRRGRKSERFRRRDRRRNGLSCSGRRPHQHRTQHPAALSAGRRAHLLKLHLLWRKGGIGRQFHHNSR